MLTDRPRAVVMYCCALHALEIFRAKGADAHAGQVLRSYAEASTTHWRHKWAAVPEAFNAAGA